ncbi:branched-chain amino acid ABC transporter permease [bacterium]|nr:branched-chain amino acid ABC transporter permease [bacterium]
MGAAFRSRYWLIAVACVWLIQFVAIDQVDPYYFSIIMYAGMNVVLAVSLNLVNGFTGQFSMGHAGFMSIGAYTAAYFSKNMIAADPQWATGAMSSFLLLGALLTGGVAAAFAGLIVGLPSLRLKGDYLAIVTLGFGEIIRVMILNIETVGGARGYADIPLLSTFGWVYSWVVFTLFVVWRLVHSPTGRALMSVREDEIASESMGVNTTRTKVGAFVIGAAFAGTGGALFGHFLRYLNPAIFDFNRSFEFIIMVVLGGMGSITGSAIAAILLTVLKEALRPLQQLTQIDFRMIIYSLLLIALMLTRPNGLFGRRELPSLISAWRWRRKREVSGRGVS